MIAGSRPRLTKARDESNLTVLQLPEWREGNSYLNSLSESLGTQGVRVVFPSDLPGRLFSTSTLRSVDLVHLHWPEAHLGASSKLEALLRAIYFMFYLMLVKTSGRGIVWTAHNLGSHQPPWPGLDRWVYRYIARVADRIIVHYPDARGLLAEWLGVGGLATEVIDHPAFSVPPEAVSMSDARERLGLDQNAPIVLYLGSIRTYKNTIRLMKAFRLSAHGGARLVIAGWVSDPSLKQGIELIASQDDRIRAILEFIPDEQVDDLMAAADVVAVPHTSGLTKGSAILAMSHGKAIVGSDCPHLRYLLGSTQSDLLFDPEDIDDIARTISMALTDRKRLGLIGEHNRQRISQRTWEEAGQRLSRTYRAIGGRS